MVCFQQDFLLAEGTDSCIQGASAHLDVLSCFDRERNGEIGSGGRREGYITRLLEAVKNCINTNTEAIIISNF